MNLLKRRWAPAYEGATAELGVMLAGAARRRITFGPIL
ncbi:hypothetical protein GP5015_1766 [gamma proteobacterium HTCC5015]|nr:hypothetical protein GP5015_1766 [gamma proteobacterium HTCC5015]